MGIFDEYTILNYMDIKADNTTIISNDEISENLNFNVFPNPSNSLVKFRFTLSAKPEIHLFVYNHLGQVITNISEEYLVAIML